MATIAPAAAVERSFYQKMAIGLAVFILFGFGQFAARGMVDLTVVPPIVHLHAGMMTAWLVLLVVQAVLADRGGMALHRRLGWFGAALVTVTPLVAIATCVTMLRLHAVPPFFTQGFFLSLVVVEAILFSALVWLAIVRRKQTDWHRRLILGATIILMEPALGRLLPVPLIGGDLSEWLAMGVQLGAVYIIARHDLAVVGRVHPATRFAALAVVFSHVMVALLAALPPVQTLAQALAGTIAA